MADNDDISEIAVKDNLRGRMLVTIKFSTSFDILPFPPADYYPDNTLSTFTTYRNYINALALTLLVLAVIIVPKRMHLHALSLGYIPSLIYLGMGVTPANYTDWVQFTLKELKVMAMVGGTSFGQCCQSLNEDF